MATFLLSIDTLDMLDHPSTLIAGNGILLKQWEGGDERETTLVSRTSEEEHILRAIALRFGFKVLGVINYRMLDLRLKDGSKNVLLTMVGSWLLILHIMSYHPRVIEDSIDKLDRGHLPSPTDETGENYSD